MPMTNVEITLKLIFADDVNDEIRRLEISEIPKNVLQIISCLLVIIDCVTLV